MTDRRLICPPAPVESLDLDTCSRLCAIGDSGRLSPQNDWLRSSLMRRQLGGCACFPHTQTLIVDSINAQPYRSGRAGRQYGTPTLMAAHPKFVGSYA
jgi:hypothetical protein